MSKKLVLGTAQLYLGNYGITSDKEKMSKKKILNILNFAWEKGIKYFDTAPSYKNEQIIGDFIYSKKISNKIKILTKLSNLKKDHNILKEACASISLSLKKLAVDKIFCLFIHNQKDFYKIRKEKLFFRTLKKEFNIKNFGFSVYDKYLADRILDEYPNSSIQFPYNIINKKFETLKKRQSVFFARSIFLQGLLISSKIKAINKNLIRQHKRYIEFIKLYNLDPLKLSLDFVNNNSDIDFLIFGVKNKKQMRSIINYKPKRIDFKIIKKIQNFFKGKESDPRSWLS